MWYLVLQLLIVFISTAHSTDVLPSRIIEGAYCDPHLSQLIRSHTTDDFDYYDPAVIKDDTDLGWEIVSDPQTCRDKCTQIYNQNEFPDGEGGTMTDHRICTSVFVVAGTETTGVNDNQFVCYYHKICPYKKIKNLPAEKLSAYTIYVDNNSTYQRYVFEN